MGRGGLFGFWLSGVVLWGLGFGEFRGLGSLGSLGFRGLGSCVFKGLGVYSVREFRV